MLNILGGILLQKNTVLILVIIAIGLGVFVSIFWLFAGSFFISGIIAGIMETFTEEEIPLTFANLMPGFIIVTIQSIITIIALTLATMKAMPSRLHSNLKKNGIWILMLGFTILVVNPVLFISSILLITGGSIALKNADNNNINTT